MPFKKMHMGKIEWGSLKPKEVTSGVSERSGTDVIRNMVKELEQKDRAELSKFQSKFKDLIDKQIDLFKSFKDGNKAVAVKEYKEFEIVVKSHIQLHNNLLDMKNKLNLLSDNEILNSAKGKMIQDQMKNLEDMSEEVESRFSKITLRHKLKDFYLNNKELQHYIEDQEKLYCKLGLPSSVREADKDIKQTYNNQKNEYQDFRRDYIAFFRASGE